MNPAGQSYEAVPLQGNGGQPVGSTVVQYTTVNMSTEPAKDYIVWSLCNFAYANICCLGLAALIFSVKARDRKVMGDLDGAQHYASTACCLNTWVAILFSIIIIAVIITVIVLMGKLNAMMPRTYSRGSFFDLYPYGG